MLQSWGLKYFFLRIIYNRNLEISMYKSASKASSRLYGFLYCFSDMPRMLASGPK
jgi:hypothetical protein